ncbi:MAG: Clp protease N-terminal domain-containing protein [Candidatus Dormibacteria bacterium]
MSETLGALDPNAETALALARRSSEEARLGHIGTEHVLLGLLATRESAAALTLGRLGVTLPKVEAELVEQAMTTQRIILSSTMASALAENVFQAARRRADDAGRPEVNTDDLLLGLMRETDGVAYKVLTELGVSYEQVAEGLTGA